MKNGKNEALEPLMRKNWSFKRRGIVLALVLLAASTVLPSWLGTQVALADSGGERGHNFNVTFTKWITSYPNMGGIVGGKVGTGTFAGEILNRVPGPSITNIEALYHINGSKHSFTAHVFVTQDEVNLTAVVEGVVTEGWLKGKPVHGKYNIISCPDKPSGRCFQGTLRIHVGSKG